LTETCLPLRAQGEAEAQPVGLAGERALEAWRATGFGARAGAGVATPNPAPHSTRQ